jgi:AP-4 complex subunit mu-1
VMNYRMTQEFKPPFRVTALIEEAGPSRVFFLFFFSHISSKNIKQLFLLEYYTVRV